MEYAVRTPGAVTLAAGGLMRLRRGGGTPPMDDVDQADVAWQAAAFRSTCPASLSGAAILADSTPCVILGPPGSGKSMLAGLLKATQTENQSARSLRRNLAEAEQSYTDLEYAQAFKHYYAAIPVSLFFGLRADLGDSSLIPGSTAFSLVINPSDRPWSSSDGTVFSTDTPAVTDQPVTQWRVTGFSWIIDASLLPGFRQSLLLLVDGVRASLRLALIRALSALSVIPDVLSFVFTMLAAARRYGQRCETGDYTSAVFASTPFIFGDAIRLC